MEFVGPQLVVFREQILHHQIGVQLCHAVDRKAADHAQVCHPHLFIMMHCQLGPHRVVARPVFIHQLFEVGVDLFDDGEVARQQAAYQFLIPALQRLRHQGMVGVGEGLAGDGPGGIPLQLMLIQQNAQHFRNGDGRVSIVQLDHFVLRQVFNLAARQMVLTQNIRHRTGALEVLLHQAQALARLVVVIRIQHLSQLGGFHALLLRLQEFAIVEIAQIKRMLMGGLPQT
ncbi:hypothetical protein D3C78_1068520 [compost metagenome]